MNNVRFITTPGGEELAVLARADYERLLGELEMQEDVRLYDEAKAALAAGEDELIPSEIVGRLLDGENKVRVWREFRALTPVETAARAGISEARLAEIEKGSGPSDMEAIEALAPVLKVAPEDLLPRSE